MKYLTYFLSLAVIFLPAFLTIWWLVGFGMITLIIFLFIHAILGKHYAKAFACDCVLALIPPFDPVMELRYRMKKRFYGQV